MASHDKKTRGEAGFIYSAADSPESGAVEEGVDAPRHNFFTPLYAGTGAFDIIGKRRLWFSISGAIIVIAIASIAIRGFTLGIDFQGGTKVSFPRGSATVQQVDDGNGASATVQIRSEALSNDQTAKLRDALFNEFHPVGVDGKPSQQAIS